MIDRAITSPLKRPLPQDWLVRFDRLIDRDPELVRVRNKILPHCDLKKLAHLIVMYLLGLPGSLPALRKQRGKNAKQELRRTARELSTKLRSLGPNDVERPAVAADLAQAKAKLARAPRAFGTDRLGRTGAMCTVIMIREYLRAKSGIEPSFRELEAVLRCGMDAGQLWSARAESSDLETRNVDEDVLRLRVGRFEARCPEIVASLRARAVQL